jgi:hypothetical protein
MLVFCFVANFIAFYGDFPITYVEPFVIPAPTYEMARLCALSP